MKKRPAFNEKKVVIWTTLMCKYPIKYSFDCDCDFTATVPRHRDVTNQSSNRLPHRRNGWREQYCEIHAKRTRWLRHQNIPRIQPHSRLPVHLHGGSQSSANHPKPIYCGPTGQLPRQLHRPRHEKIFGNCDVTFGWGFALSCGGSWRRKLSGSVYTERTRWLRCEVVPGRHANMSIQL